MAGTSNVGKLRGLGLLGLLIGLLLLGASFVAAGDADTPRCDGKTMHPGDSCWGSGAESYDQRASHAHTAATSMRCIGGALAVGGVAALIGAAAGSRRD